MSKTISYGKQTIDQSDIDAVVKVLKGDWLTQGPAVENFEIDLKTYFGAYHSCAVSNGTAALHLAGLALGWKPGDTVITSPITFLATANAIIYNGATIDFVDINPKTYTIDPNLLEEKVKKHYENGKKIKAIIGVDYAGHPCDWEAIKSIANKFEIQLINDNCHALGASLKNDKYYAAEYADIVTQSFHPVKHFTTGEGGAVLTNNVHLDEMVRRLRTHGITKDPDKLLQNNGPWYYEMHELGYNYRITDFQCALGSNQLKKLDDFVYRRQQIAAEYDKHFEHCQYLQIPEIDGNVGHAYHLYPLQIDFNKLKLKKLDFFIKMKKSGINLQVHYIPVHLQPYYQKNYGFNIGDFPISERFYKNEVSLPIYPDLSTGDVSSVKNNISEIISA
tara:strand:+ start:65 stop:1237 length:1173 start_codon:yes stop_codon:yes gene_type:complete